MNLFLLSTNCKRNAKFHCDKHVVKMILELVQCLYTAWHVLEGTDTLETVCTTPKIYKPTHKSHPLGVWIRKSLDNYLYVAETAVCLAKEYTRRYDKIHACEVHAKWLRYNVPSKFASSEFTPPPQCMPEEYRVNYNKKYTWGDAVKAYREYYRKEKANFSTWKTRPTPDFMK